MSETTPKAKKEYSEYKDFWNLGCVFCGKLNSIKAKTSVLTERHILWECFACTGTWTTKVKNDLYESEPRRPEEPHPENVPRTEEQVGSKPERKPRITRKHN